MRNKKWGFLMCGLIHTLTFKKKLVYGFTMIEFLIVVAIIGILASIILVDLNSARGQSIDAIIKVTMANARAQATSFYEDAGQTYNNVCINPGGIGPIVLDAARKLAIANVVGITTDPYVYAAAGALGSSVCHHSPTEWAAVTSLKNPEESATGGWCVDFTGASKESASLGANVTVCP